MRAAGVGAAMSAAALAWGISDAHAVTLRGVVTGEVAHLPWRKGKEELGWCTVLLVDMERPTGVLASTRTQGGTGAFEFSTPHRGRASLVIKRPGFLPFTTALELGEAAPPPVRARLERDPTYGWIVRPRLGTAEFCVPGGEFPIEVLAPPELRQWRALLMRGRFPHVYACELSVPRSEYGEGAVWHGTKAGWRLRAKVPQGTPPGLYRLDVVCTDPEGTPVGSTQDGAVCVLPRWPSRFRLMPYLDFHLDWHVKKPGEAGEVQKDFFKAASLLNPLFVSLGDDVGFETDDAVAMFHYLVSHHCTVPVYLAFGNHDAGIGIEGHEYYFGPRWQTRCIGPHIGLILSYDLYQAEYDLPAEQKRFVNDALARFHADPRVKLLFLAGHLHAWKPRRDYFRLPFPPAERPTLTAHTEGGKTLEAERLFMHSLSVSSMHGWAGRNYTGRVMELEGLAEDAARVKTTVLPQAALPAVAFARPNDGTARTNTATVRLRGLSGEWTPPEKLYTGGYFCDLPERFRGLPAIPHARLRFVMARGRYRASRGRILRQTDTTRATAVDVAVDVAETAVAVTLSPE